MTQPITDDTAQEQFEVSMEEATAKLVYELDDDRLLLRHTEVPNTFQADWRCHRGLQDGAS